jgi:hypothetical protein
MPFVKSRSIFLALLFSAPLLCQAAKRHDPQEMAFDAARLPQYSNIELIDLLSEKSLEKNAQGKGMFSVLPPDRRIVPVSGPGDDTHVKLALDSHALDFTITVEQELSRRNAQNDLMDIFERTQEDTQQAWMMDALAQMRSASVDAFFRRFTHGKTSEPATYLSLKYFAEVCDPEALAILNKHYFQYQTSSMEWASIVRSFGACKYKPAALHLVETVSAMMLDLGYASHLSLAAIYPDAKIDFAGPGKTREAWERYLSHR